MKTALIVGGDSTIGLAIAAACTAKGIQVERTSRRCTVETLALDLDKPVDTWAIMPPVDVAYICAAIVQPHACETQPDTTAFINVVQTQRLAERLLAQGTHLCFFSTNQVFDGTQPMRSCDEPVSPLSQYGKQKAAIETYLLQQHASMAVLRLTKVISAPLPIIRQWKSALLRGETIEAFTDLVFAPVPIADVVHAAIKIGTERSNGIFHLSGYEDISFFQAAKHLAQYLGVDTNLVQPSTAASRGVLPQLRPLHTTLQSSQELLNYSIPSAVEALDFSYKTYFTQPVSVSPQMEALCPSNLARFGGIPVRSTPMPSRYALGPGERSMIEAVLQHYAEQKLDPGYQGHFEHLYCDAFATAMGGGYADAVSSGTSAIYIAIKALDLPANSEIIVSPITDPGSVNAIIHAGHRVRLADSRPDSFNIGVEEFVARISPQTRAVLVVHASGQAAEIDAIVAEAHARNIRVIEDCSQAHLARRHGTPVGTFGDIAAFSTMYRKASIAGGSGGMVFTRDLDLYRRALAYADRGKTPWVPGFDDKDPAHFLLPALNHNADEISCAIGLASWSRLPATIEARMTFVRGLDRLRQQARICRPYGWTQGDSPFYYPIFVDAHKLPVAKTDFALSVAAEGIGLNHHYKYLVADWPYLRPYLTDDFETANARSARDRSFILYLNENYGPTEVDDTIAAIRKVEDAYLG